MSDSAPLSVFYVYILRCADGSLYVGHSSDIAARVRTHNEGRGATWTAARRPLELLYSEPSDSEQAAVARERQLKGWTKAKKLALISGDIEALRRLAQRTRSHAR